jgi:hypothetical protein
VASKWRARRIIKASYLEDLLACHQRAALPRGGRPHLAGGVAAAELQAPEKALAVGACVW